MQQQQLLQQQMQQQQLQGGYTMPLHNNPFNNQQLSKGAQTSISNLFLSRIGPNVDINDIRNCLHSSGVNVINIVKVSNSLAKFKSFKICVHSNDYSKVSNNPVWPLCGAKCRPWNDRGNNMGNNYNSSNNNYNNVNYDSWDRLSFNTNH